MTINVRLAFRSVNGLDSFKSLQTSCGNMKFLLIKNLHLSLCMYLVRVHEDVSPAFVYHIEAKFDVFVLSL